MERGRRAGLGSFQPAFAFRDLFLHNRQHETIDWVRAASLPNPLLPAGCPVNTWCATNLNGLHFLGVEANVAWIPAKAQRIQIGWTWLAGVQPPLPGLQSDTLSVIWSNNIHATWTAGVGRLSTVTNSVQVTKAYYVSRREIPHGTPRPTLCGTRSSPTCRCGAQSHTP